jgi:hypothetical protein
MNCPYTLYISNLICHSERSEESQPFCRSERTTLQPQDDKESKWKIYSSNKNF